MLTEILLLYVDKGVEIAPAVSVPCLSAELFVEYYTECVCFVQMGALCVMWTLYGCPSQLNENLIVNEKQINSQVDHRK